jgi:glycosyltransferase involved in cell wall biosynthesis
MDTRFVLAYSGSLAYFSGRKKKAGLRSFFATYHHRTTDESTRSPFYLFKAVQKLDGEKKITPATFRMLFWGLVDERNKRLATDLGISEYLEVRGYMGKKESGELLVSCDALFLPLERSGSGEPLFIPGKLYEYLGTGKPVLALAEAASDAGRILSGSGAALVCPPDDVERIAAAILQLLEGRARLHADPAYVARFSWDRMAAEICGIFQRELSK